MLNEICLHKHQAIISELPIHKRLVRVCKDCQEILELYYIEDICIVIRQQNNRLNILKKDIQFTNAICNLRNIDSDDSKLVNQVALEHATTKKQVKYLELILGDILNEE